MKKIFILILFLMVTQSNYAFILDGLLKIEDSVDAIKIAAVDLEHYADQITTFRRTIYTGRSFVTIDDYWCESLAAKRSINEYNNQEQALQLKILLSLLFDTFVLANIAGYCHAKFNMKMPTVICGIMAAALGIVAHQNNKMKNVPYFDFYLKRHEDRFDNFNFFSAFRFAFITIEAGLMAYLTRAFYEIPFN